jgi:hypothetical protein
MAIDFARPGTHPPYLRWNEFNTDIGIGLHKACAPDGDGLGRIGSEITERKSVGRRK